MIDILVLQQNGIKLECFGNVIYSTGLTLNRLTATIAQNTVHNALNTHRHMSISHTYRIKQIVKLISTKTHYPNAVVQPNTDSLSIRETNQPNALFGPNP